MSHTVRVAVVGSGLAGLTASYLLTRPLQSQDDVKIEVHLFEKAVEIGMDSASTSIPSDADDYSCEKEWRVDVPMRSFQGGYYPNLISLYKRLGLSFKPSNFTYSFSFLDSSSSQAFPTITTTALYNGKGGRRGVGRPTILFGQPRSKEETLVNYWFRQLLTTGLFFMITAQLAVCYLITLWHSIPWWRPKRVASMTFREWAMQATPTGWFARTAGLDIAWEDYVQTMFIPLMSAMCTAPEEDILNHPVEEMLDYCWTAIGRNHYVLENGVRDVVTRLSSTLQHMHLGTSIVAIKPDPTDEGQASIECLDSTGMPQVYGNFDHIVLATQASRAVPLLQSYVGGLKGRQNVQQQAVQDQIACLQKFKYCRTVVVNHTDDSLLPKDPKDRRDLNLITADWEEADNKDFHLCVPPTYTMATHTLYRPQGHKAKFPTVHQTTNPLIPPRQDAILSTASLERAVLTLESKRALNGLCKREEGAWWKCATQKPCSLGNLQGAGKMVDRRVPGIWICGSYAHSGIPLLEGCVVSARNVVEQGILKSEGLCLREAPWGI